MHTSSFHSMDSASRYGRLMRACCEGLEMRRLMAVTTEGDLFGAVDGQNLILQQTDVDGDIVRYSLTGGGTGQLVDGGLVLTGTTPGSNLNITVRRSGGDGLVTVSGIQADGAMRAINAQAAVVGGDVLLNTGAAGDTSRTAAITLREMQNGSIDSGGQALSSVRLQNWAASDVTQELRAPWIRTLSVVGRKGTGLAGDLGATLQLADRDQNIVALRTATVGGTLIGINAPSGGINTLTAGAINGTISALFINTLRTRAVQGSETADGSASGEIRALGSAPSGRRGAINTLQINGDTDFLTIRADESGLGNITITGNALDTRIFTVGGAQNIRVGQMFSNSRIQTQAGVALINLGAMDNSNVLVGVAPTFDGAFAATSDDFAAGADTVARLQNFTVGRNQGATAPAQVTGTNNLSAAQVGNIRVFNMESTTPPSLNIFVLDDPATVRNVDNANPANNFNWRRGQSQPALLDAMLTNVTT